MTAVAVIVGAGISGLAAAYELHRRGVVPLVLEASDRAGGLILTEREGPYVLDAGPDAMLASKRAGIALCEELGVAGRLMPASPPRTAFVLRAGRLRPLPQPSVLGLPATWRALAGASFLSWRGRARIAVAPLIPSSRAADESIGSFIGRRFGREAVDFIAEPLLAGIHAGDVDRLSVRALFPSLVSEPGTRTTNEEPRTTNQFLSFPTGMAELPDALVGALPAGALRTGARVERVERIGRGYRVHLKAGPIDARVVILAAPAWAGAGILAPFDADLGALAREVPYTSSAIVALAYDRDAVRHPLAGSGFVVPRVERGVPILAATWISSKWAGRAPRGRVLLRAFLGGARDPGAVDRSDAALVDAATAALSPLLRILGPPLLARVYRWPRAAAQHEVGHLARLEAIDRRLAAHPGLFVTGSGFRVTGIPDCVADAREVAANAARYVEGLRAERAEGAEKTVTAETQRRRGTQRQD